MFLHKDTWIVECNMWDLEIVFSVAACSDTLTRRSQAQRHFELRLQTRVIICGNLIVRRLPASYNLSLTCCLTLFQGLRPRPILPKRTFFGRDRVRGPALPASGLLGSLWGPTCYVPR